jgi:predicted transcriptional regulator
MSTAELKSNLYKLIDSINDSQTLQAIYTLLSTKAAAVDDDFWDKFSDEQKTEIEESIAELNRGEGISHEQVMKEMKAKYKI